MGTPKQNSTALKTIEGDDRCYYAAGNNNSDSLTYENYLGKNSICISKLDSTGKIIWKKSYYKNSVLLGFIKIENNNFITLRYDFDATGCIGGSCTKNFRIDSSGNVIWEFQGNYGFNAIYNYSEKSFQLISTSGLAIYDFNKNLIKETLFTPKLPFNSQGTLLYNQEFAFKNFNKVEVIDSTGKFIYSIDFSEINNKIYLSQIIQSSDSNFVLIGKQINSRNESEYYISKYNRNGIKMWKYINLIPSYFSEIKCGIETKEKDILVAGNFNLDFNIIRLNSNGEKICEKLGDFKNENFENFDAAIENFCKTRNGGFMLSGSNTKIFSSGNTNTHYRDPLFIKADSQLINSPAVELGPNRKICLGDTIVLDAGSTGTSYIWSTGELTQKIKVFLPGLYLVMVFNEENCFRTDSVLVELKLPSIVYLGPDQKICGSTFVLNAGLAQEYYWSTGESSSSITVNTSGTYWVRVLTADSFCYGIDSINIEFIENPKLIYEDTTLCKGDKLILKTNGTELIRVWQDGSTNATYEVNKSGLYWVLLENSCYTGIDSIYVTFVDKPSLSTNISEIEICLNSSIELEAMGCKNYSWSPNLWINNTNSAKVIVKPETDIIYTVKGYNQLGCFDSAKIQVKVLRKPAALYKYIKKSSSVNFEGIDNNQILSWEWDFGDRSAKSTEQNPIHFYIQKGQYSITLIVRNDCFADTIEFEIEINGQPGSGGNTSVKSDLKQYDFDVFPNPASDFIKLEFSGSFNNLEVQILDNLGRIKKTFYLKEEEVIENISVKELSTGLYFIRVVLDHTYLGMKKIIILSKN